MIIIQIQEGLGNQMFQYALGLHVSIKFSEPLYFDLTDYRQQQLRKFELNVFGIDNKEVNAATRFYYNGLIKIINFTGIKYKNVFSEKSFAFDEKVFKTPYPVYYNGFFQSYKYFDNISSEVRKRLSFIYPLDQANQLIVSQITTSNSISLHIRRGDYVFWEKFNSSHVLCGLDYYEKGIEHIQQKTKNCRFFIFSDDPKWIRANMKFDYVLIEGNVGENSWKDMYLMSLCKHHIIANSTFSWWGAWLNPSTDKIVIAPQKWFGNETNEEMKDLCPPEWIRM